MMASAPDSVDDIDDDIDDDAANASAASTYAAALRRPWSRLRAIMDAVEGGLFAFFATLLSLVQLMLSLMILADLATDDRHFDTTPLIRKMISVVFVGFSILWLCLDLPMVFRVWPALLGGRHPVAVHAALGQRRYWWPLRPLIAVWWLAHFLLGFAGAVAAEQMPTHGDPNHPNPETPIVYFMVFTYTLAANGFLMQALRALGASERTLERAWFWRILIDASVLIAGFVVGRAV